MKNLKIFFIINFILLSVMFNNSLAQDVNRNEPPKLPPPSKLNLPSIQNFELSNGLKVYLMEKHQVPLVQLNVVIHAGTVNDPKDKAGEASMAMDMLMEGAANKSSLELSDAIDFLGVRIRSAAGYHFSSISLHTPYSKFDDALKILSDIILRPDFPAKELARKQKERLTSLMQWHDQPTIIASVAFNKLLFGKDYPYGRSSFGNESSIKSFTSNNLKNFHDKYFKSNNAFIVAVGDISKNELKSKLESAFGSWQKGEVKIEKLNDAPQVAKRIVYLIDKPGAPQSVIYIGRVGVPRTNEDFNAINVMNAILGGSFSSRINMNLREKHGYTYGAHSYFDFREAAGPFIATSSVQTEVTDKSLTEFFNELNGIRNPISEDEINRGKNYIALSYPNNFQTVANIAYGIESMVEYNLPENYFNDYISNVLKLNADVIDKAAQKYILPDQMIVVVVGDRSKIEDGIKKLNLGEIKNLTIEDVLGKIPKID